MAMTLQDLFGPGGHGKRPDHPDFWRLSEIILELKADMQEATSNADQERRWRAHYEEIGDFDSIAYHAIQAAMQIHNVETSTDWAMLMADRRKHEAYVGTIQAYFDGFIMGAEFERRGGHREPGPEEPDGPEFVSDDLRDTLRELRDPDSPDSQ